MIFISIFYVIAGAIGFLLVCFFISFVYRKYKSVDKSVLSFHEFVGKLSPFELSQKVSEFASKPDKLKGITKINLRGMPLVNRGCFDSVCSLLSQSNAQSVNLSSVTGEEYRYYNSTSTGFVSGSASVPAKDFSRNQATLASSLPDSCTELSLCNFNNITGRQCIDLLGFLPNLQGKNIKILDISSNKNGRTKFRCNYLENIYWQNIFKKLPNSVRELKLNGNYIGECIKEDKISELDENKAYFVTKLHLSSIDVQNNSVQEIQAFLEHFFPNLQELEFSDDCFNDHILDREAENVKIKQLKAIYSNKRKNNTEKIGEVYNALSNYLPPVELLKLIGDFLVVEHNFVFNEQAQQYTSSSSSLTK